MKISPRVTPATLFVLIAVLLPPIFAACGMGSQAPRPIEKAKIVVPDGGSTPSGNAPSQVGADVTQEVLTPKVPIRKEDNLLQAINVNLDLDQSEEQILVLKDKEKADAPIRVAVADYDNVRNEYVMSWEHATNATNIRTFTVTTEDIIGDHNLEIICTGMNSKGEQTLNIFRKTHPPTGVNLYYTEIFSIAVKGTIDIERHERSQAYKLGQKNGTSYSIVTYSRDPNGEHIGDLVKKTYNWRYQTNTYVETDQEKIPGKQIEDQRLNDLYTKGADAFETFLAGPWFKASGNGAKAANDPTASTPDTSNTILFFDPAKKEITFYSGDVMEVYYWENSYRTLYNRLVISGYNELVQYIKAQISISVTSINHIEVYSPDEWAGTYEKLTESMQQSLIKTANEPYTPPDLSGRYSSPNGSTIDFNAPRFVLDEGGTKRSGGYSVFDYGAPVIELRFLSPGGIVEGTRSYKIDWGEQKSKTQIVRKLTMTPGRLGIHGFVATGDPPLQYEQVETLQTDGSSSQGGSNAQNGASASGGGAASANSSPASPAAAAAKQ